MTVRKILDVHDTAILHAIKRAGASSRKKWLFAEEIVPFYELAVGALRVTGLRPASVASRLERLAHQGLVMAAWKPKAVRLRGEIGPHHIRAYRMAEA
jgi:hypothetical protein